MPTIFSKEQSISVALLIGEILLRSGAETYRVEDTIRRICGEQGYKDIQPFITPTLIMIGDNSTDNKMAMMRIKSRSTHLDKISAINDFSYSYRKQDLTYEQILDHLNAIKNKPVYNKYLQAIAMGIGSAFFTVMLGGTMPDFISSILAACIATYVSQNADRRYGSFFLSNALAGFLVGGIACVSALMYEGIEVDKVIVGSIMPFVPGLAFTNGIRDFLSGDLISGNSRVAEAVMSACSTALGVGVVLKLVILIQGRWW